MKKYALLFCSLFFLLCFTQKEESPKPNFVIVLLDDLGYGDFGCFGSKVIKTPNIDQLAATGVRLTQFYSGSTVCAPSRCALMTGKHTGHAYIRGNGEIPLRKQDTTLAQLLKEIGYTTAIFGKWGLGDINTEGSPDLKGWDEFLGYLHHIEGHYQAPGVAWEYNKNLPKPTRIGANFGGFACDRFNERTLEFINKQAPNKPFFVELALTLPHAELYAPKEAMQRYQNAKGESIFPEKPFQGSHYGGQTQPKASYAAMVSRADDYVGQIRELLVKKGLDKNTIIIVTSDNGTHIEGGRTIDDVRFMNSSGGLRGVKRELYEGGIRSPTIVWGADMPTGIVREGQGAFWDILPTFLEMAGSKKSIETDGISLYSHWKTGKYLPNDRPLYWEFSEGGFVQAVRVGDWKLVVKQQKNASEIVELYNLKDDVGETKNLASSHPEKVIFMRDWRSKLHTKSSVPLFQQKGE